MAKAGPLQATGSASRCRAGSSSTRFSDFALARDVFYGRRGRINARELWEQMNICSCLNLILACIVYWQAWEISQVLRQCDPLANGADLTPLEHVNPPRAG
jgi:hypothetical protein